MALKLLVFSGSIRKDSCNKKLSSHAAKIAASMGADVTYIDLTNYPMPIYNGDLEENKGIPKNGQKIKKMFLESDGIIISSPEYNSSFSPLLKNTLDWISRPEESDPIYLVAFRQKPFLLLSASPGELGGLRGLVALRSILNNIFAYAFPEQMCLSNAYEAFDESGAFFDKKKDKQLSQLVENFMTFAKTFVK